MGADMIAHVLDGAMDRSVLVERAMRPQLVIVGGILARIAERYPRLEFRVVESDAGTLCCGSAKSILLFAAPLKRCIRLISRRNVCLKKPWLSSRASKIHGRRAAR